MKLYCEHEIALPAEAFWTILHAPALEGLLERAAVAMVTDAYAKGAAVAERTSRAEAKGDNA